MTGKAFSDYGITIPSNAVGGGNVYTTCPWCSSQRKNKNAKCLSVNIDKGAWICNHCGIVGGLGKNNDYAKEPHWNKPKYVRPAPRPLVHLPGKVIDWFFDRGVSSEILARNKIGFEIAYMPQVEEDVEAIVFPYFRGGELINRKYRAFADKQFRLETRAELILYGLDDIDPECVTIVEGEIDKLSLEMAGFLSVVSVPNGAPPPTTKEYSTHLRYLEADWEKLESVKKFILAVDADEPGKRLEEELTRRLGIEKCVRAKWPEGCKDANEVLVRHGATDLRWYIDNAEPFPIEGAIEAMDRLDAVERFYVFGFESGVSTGWPTLDLHYKIRPGQLTVVSGVPGSGKSNFVDSLIVNIARNHGWRFAVFSPENLPVEQHIAMIAEKYVGKPFHAGPTPRMSPSELQNGLEWLHHHFSWILPHDESQWEVDNILKIAGQLCLRNGIRGLVIDPWNELEPLRPAYMTETEYVSQCLKRIRVFARQRDVHVWLVAHPAKLYRNKDGKYPVPTLYDISGSANWRNKADNGVIIWRDLESFDSTEVQVHIQKIRFRQDGCRGAVKLYYEPACATYGEELISHYTHNYENG